MQATSTSTGANRIWPNWWRMAGVDGIIWAVLFVVGAIALQGDTPARSDSIDEIRQYFVDDGDKYLIGDYMISLGFLIFFVPYVIGLRWVLGSREGSPAIWSWMAFSGGILATILGAASGMGWGALALGLKDNPDLNDATLRFLVDMNYYGFALVELAVALFVGSAGFVVFRTGVLWKWLGIIGLIAAIMLVIGAAWPIDGDDEGVIAILGFIGLPATLVFVIISSIGMIMMKEPPEPIH